MDKKTLHILNGDGTAQPFRESGIPGEQLVWREILSEGPATDDIPEDDFWNLRADFLFKAYNEPREKYLSEIKKTLQQIDRANEYDEIVLWFEHDLLCQVNLMYLLNRLLMADCGSVVSLVCINHFPGIWDFRGLGQLNPEQLASLFPYRRKLNADDLQYAGVYWKAYNSENPGLLETFMQQPSPVFPFLKTASEAHLKRFPCVTNGLGRIEEKILQAIHEGSRSKTALLKEFIRQESIYGLGDSQVYDYLWDLAEPETPLVKIDGDKLEITSTGKQVLQGSLSYLELKTPERWIGGVKLSAENLWLWNPSINRLVEKNKTLLPNHASLTAVLNRNVVQDFINCINKADVDGLIRLMTSDHKFIDSQNNTLSGLEQLSAGWKVYLGMFPDYLLEVDEMYAEGNKVAIFGSAGGTFRKQKEKENNKWKLPVAWKATLEDGKIKVWQVYADTKVVFDLMDRNL